MTRLGNWWGYFRQHGLRATGHAIINRVYRSQQWLVVRVDLAGPPAPDHVGDVVLRYATSSDLEHLDEFERFGRGSIQRRYVETDKDWFFVACHDARVVATARVSRVVRDAVLSRVVQLRDGQVWGADHFCLPEYRSRRISRQLAVFSQRFLAAQGYKELFGSVTVDNAPALRLSPNAGSKLVSHVSYVRILFWERLRVSTDIPKELWGGWGDRRSVRLPGGFPLRD